MKFKNFLLILIGIVFLFIPGYAADSGTLTIESQAVHAYSTSGLTSGAASIDFNNFRIDATNYDILYSFDLNLSGIENFPAESSSTTFTCTSGCTGSGTVSYTKSTGKVYWLTGANSITISDSNITFSYTAPIFNGFTDVNVLVRNDLETVSSTQPIKIESTGGSIMSKNPTNGRVFDYDSFTALSVSNSYSVNYSTNALGQIIFNTSVDKSGTSVPTRITLKNQTNVNYSTESTLTTSSFTILNTLTTGIYIRGETSSGSFAEATINTSGAVVPTPTPIGGGGSSSGQIYFDYTNATPGAVYGINASITDANFSSFDTYFIDVFDPAGIEIIGFPASFGTQNYSTGRFYYFDKFGTYTANLSYCSFINPLCPSVISPTHLDTASLTVNQVALVYNITTDKANYQNGDNIYINATNPGLTKAYITVTNNGGIVTDIAWNSEVAPNSVKNITAVISNNLPLGRYLVSLADNAAYHVVAQTMFNITAIPSTPNTLGLGWAFPPSGIYITGNTGVLTYTTNMNSSTVSIYSQGANQNLILEKSFIASAVNTTGNYSQTFNKPGIWYANIVDNNDATKFLWSNTTVNDANPSDPDAQKLCKSKENYVCWDKHEYYQGDSYIINYKLVVPSVITYYPTIKIYDPSDTVVKTVKLNYSIWNNTITGAISGKFSTSAKTGIWFVKAEKINQVTGEDNGEIANSATSVIGRNVSAGATPPSGDAAFAGAGGNLRTLVSQPFFWGLVILALILYTIRNTRVVKEVSIFVIFVEDVMGLFAPYTIFILIGLIIFAAISLRTGKQIVTGED